MTIFENDFKVFSAYQNTSNLNNLEYKDYMNKLSISVLTPLNNLLNSLNLGPNKLIEKRNDKLVDYEVCISDVKLRANNGYVSKQVNLF